MVLREFFDYVAAAEVRFSTLFMSSVILGEINLYFEETFVFFFFFQFSCFFYLIQDNSEHPLAKAIVEHAKKFYSEENHIWPEARDFISVPGHGVRAKVCDRSVIVGNKSFMLSSSIDIPVEASEILMEEEEKAQTGIIVAMDQEVVGIISVSDPIKPNAREVISYLKSMNVESIMVTGDNWGTANAIGKEVGIEKIIAEAKPEQKAEKVKELQVSYMY
jgi:P-type Cu+ transporter